jgi:hypothetical protein
MDCSIFNEFSIHTSKRERETHKEAAAEAEAKIIFNISATDERYKF